MSTYLAEFLGTAILVLLGDGVCANVLLKGTKGNGSGWMVITAGWAVAVFIAVACVGDISGGHINPAVTLGLAVAGSFPWAQVPGYLVAQMAGALVGALIVYGFHQPFFEQTDDADDKLAVFCTAPALRRIPHAFFCEVVATFVLIFAVLMMVQPAWEAPSGQLMKIQAGSIGALPVALVVFGIGLSLGGTTGYAINPARDLGPRLAHALLPIPRKRDSDWSYAWVPVAGPMVGAVVAALLYLGLGS
ncbi:MAG: putative glycerol uptake facilitator protein [Pirellulaceae bacterium]|nr:MAG: putative glycerol uptake facilitator protein [Pirellulaceae bacterium]